LTTNNIKSRHGLKCGHEAIKVRTRVDNTTKIFAHEHLVNEFRLIQKFK
jgi:hypothetical protein